jgi:hypothetical protein
MAGDTGKLVMRTTINVRRHSCDPCEDYPACEHFLDETEEVQEQEITAEEAGLFGVHRP